MTEFKPVRKKRKIRVKTRVSDRRAGETIARLSRGKIAAVLFLAAVVGIALGMVLGRGITRMIKVRRQQDRIAQSRPAFNPDSPGSAEPGSVTGTGESPGR